MHLIRAHFLIATSFFVFSFFFQCYFRVYHNIPIFLFLQILLAMPFSYLNGYFFKSIGAQLKGLQCLHFDDTIAIQLEKACLEELLDLHRRLQMVKQVGISEVAVGFGILFEDSAGHIEGRISK